MARGRAKQPDDNLVLDPVEQQAIEAKRIALLRGKKKPGPAKGRKATAGGKRVPAFVVARRLEVVMDGIVDSVMPDEIYRRVVADAQEKKHPIPSRATVENYEGRARRALAVRRLSMKPEALRDAWHERTLRNAALAKSERFTDEGKPNPAAHASWRFFESMLRDIVAPAGPKKVEITNTPAPAPLPFDPTALDAEQLGALKQIAQIALKQRQEHATRSLGPAPAPTQAATAEVVEAAVDEPEEE